MKTSTEIPTVQSLSPLSVIEDLFIDRDWMYERRGDEELAAEITGRWCDYRIYFIWRPDVESLMMTCTIDMRPPKEHMGTLFELLALMNARMWMGHFELSLDEHMPTFRYCLSLKGAKGVTLQQIAHVIETALDESDRFYPALQFVVWGGKDAEEAAFAVMLDTAGEA